MNRSTSRSTLSSRRRGHVVVGLVTAGMIALAGQGTARAAEQPAESRTATAAVTASASATGAERGTGNGTVSARGLDPLALLDLIRDVLPVPAPLPKNNNDWK
ncbi:hypothetical protein [Streptomyces sp. NPDC013187]|uniref:hypothetical protein n=1 Tax=Streptomyces sp. NPDC013187 TaxID=3364865 RepID=UPI0036D057B2